MGDFVNPNCHGVVVGGAPGHYSRPVSLPLSSVGPVQETSPFRMTSRKQAATGGAAYESEVAVVTLPAGVEPNFVYHGRTVSHRGGQPETVSVSRLQSGMQFSNVSYQMEDSFIMVQRRAHQSEGKIDPTKFDYYIHLKKPDRTQPGISGALDKQGVVVRVNGIDYAIPKPEEPKLIVPGAGVKAKTPVEATPKVVDEDKKVGGATGVKSPPLDVKRAETKKVADRKADKTDEKKTAEGAAAGPLPGAAGERGVAAIAPDPRPSTAVKAKEPEKRAVEVTQPDKLPLNLPAELKQPKKLAPERVTTGPSVSRKLPDFDQAVDFLENGFFEPPVYHLAGENNCHQMKFGKIREGVYSIETRQIQSDGQVREDTVLLERNPNGTWTISVPQYSQGTGSTQTKRTFTTADLDNIVRGEWKDLDLPTRFAWLKDGDRFPSAPFFTNWPPSPLPSPNSPGKADVAPTPKFGGGAAGGPPHAVVPKVETFDINDVFFDHIVRSRWNMYGSKPSYHLDAFAAGVPKHQMEITVAKEGVVRLETRQISESGQVFGDTMTFTPKKGGGWQVSMFQDVVQADGSVVRVDVPADKLAKAFRGEVPELNIAGRFEMINGMSWSGPPHLFAEGKTVSNLNQKIVATKLPPKVELDPRVDRAINLLQLACSDKDSDREKVLVLLKASPLEDVVTMFETLNVGGAEQTPAVKRAAAVVREALRTPRKELAAVLLAAKHDRLDHNQLRLLNAVARGGFDLPTEVAGNPPRLYLDPKKYDRQGVSSFVDCLAESFKLHTKVEERKTENLPSVFSVRTSLRLEGGISVEFRTKESGAAKPELESLRVEIEGVKEERRFPLIGTTK